MKNLLQFADFYDENVDPEADDDNDLELIVNEGTTGFTNAILNDGQALTQDDFNDVR